MFENLIVQFGTLAGVSALVAALVNIAKVFGLPDGYAPQVSAALSFTAFTALIALSVFAPQVDVIALDQQAADFTKLALYALGFFVAMGLPARFHELFKSGGVPLIGKSNSK